MEICKNIEMPDAVAGVIKEKYKKAALEMKVGDMVVFDSRNEALSFLRWLKFFKKKGATRAVRFGVWRIE